MSDQAEQLQTFTISDDGRNITCHMCQRTSYHPEDVRHRYCGHCHVFHDVVPPKKLDPEVAAWLHRMAKELEEEQKL
jgi:hypothetical protein